MYPDMINGNASEILIDGLAPQIKYVIFAHYEIFLQMIRYKNLNTSPALTWYLKIYIVFDIWKYL